MKRRQRYRIIQPVFIVLLLVMTIATMVWPEISDLMPKPRSLEISILIRDSDSTLWSKARLGMEQAAYDMGAELRFLTPSLNNSAIEQQNLLLREAQLGCDAIVVVPADPGGMDEILDQHNLSVPVVSLESDMRNSKVFISPDNDEIGSGLAMALLEDGGADTVILLDTENRSTGVAGRMEAAKRELEAAGIKAVEVQLGAEDLPASLVGLVAEHGAEAVMAFEPLATNKAVEGVERKATAVSLYGVGATAQITAGLERGTITAVAAWSDYALGYLAVQGAVDAAQGKQAEGPETIGFSVIRGGEMYEKESQKLLFPVTY